MSRARVSLLFLALAILTADRAVAEQFDRTFVYEAETDLSHGIGYADGTGWAANVANQSTGHLVYGPYATNWGSGAGKAVFRLMIDDVTYNNAPVATIDVYCHDTDVIISTHDILRKDFAQPFVYQDFDLWFDLTTCSGGRRVEVRVRWLDRAFMNIDKVTVRVDDYAAGLPQVANLSDSSNAHVQTLVTRAINGLGFLPFDVISGIPRRDGPNANDILFVGKHYMAWIDQTGFYGKMNGLWLLNGASGDALAFVNETSSQRPVSFLGVAEDGDGAWMQGYSGSEHYEVPHEVPEPDEDPNGNGQCDTDESCQGSACVRTICNWYSVNEAAPVTDPDVPHWTACRRNRMAWARKQAPVFLEQSGRSLRLVYQAPLTKESDAARDGVQEGDHCHQDFLFADGVRRPVYLRLGYVLHGDKDYFDRSYQFDNPAGNPEFGHEVWSVIGGLVLSKQPATQPFKANLFHAIRPEANHIFSSVAPYYYPAGTWTARQPSSSSSDEVWSWLATPLSWSARGRATRGDSLRMDSLGPSDNDDVGFCVCKVHGGMEIGGGVLHRGVSLPISGGTRSIETVRRISFPSEYTLPFVYEAEGSALGKGIGRQDGDGWSAATALDGQGHLIYGPYATHWGDGNKSAVFRMMVDVVTGGGNVATLDVYDATANQVIASRVLARSAFSQPHVYQDMSLLFSLNGRLNHAIETRVWWHDSSYVKVDKVTVFDR